MSYASAINYVETSHAFGTRLNLGTLHHLLQLLGNPHQSLKIIHVAGTNGKGSTSSFLASMLAAEGYRTGLFTSPHEFALMVLKFPKRCWPILSFKLKP